VEPQLPNHQIIMKSQRHHPVNEWNSCQNSPTWERAADWNHVVPALWKTSVVSNPDGCDPAVIESTRGHGGSGPPVDDENQNTSGRNAG